MREARDILAVGLTGGMASGKSSVARILGERGCRVLDADRVVHMLLEPSQPAFGEVVRTLGTEVLGEDGRIDRKAVARIVFADEERRTALEALLHPLVLAEEQRIHRELTGRGFSGIFVTEAALMVEAGSYRRYDRVIVVHSPPEEPVRRMVALGVPEEEVRARRDAQAPVGEKLAVADYELANSGSLDDLEARVAELHDALRADWVAKRKGFLSPPRHESVS